MSTGLFSEPYVRQTLEEHLSGTRDTSLELWKLLNVSTWWHTYIDTHLPTLDALDQSPTLEPASKAHVS